MAAAKGAGDFVVRPRLPRRRDGDALEADLNGHGELDGGALVREGHQDVALVLGENLVPTKLLDPAPQRVVDLVLARAKKKRVSSSLKEENIYI